MTERRPQDAIIRRDDLHSALCGIESGDLANATCIIFAREWWDQLSPIQRRAFRKRARRAHVSLRSDSKIGSHFVEVRAGPRDDDGLSTEQLEAPYRP